MTVREGGAEDVAGAGGAKRPASFGKRGSSGGDVIDKNIERSWIKRVRGVHRALKVCKTGGFAFYVRLGECEADFTEQA